MKTNDMLYDLIKELRGEMRLMNKTISANTIVLDEHQKVSEGNSKRIQIIERKAFLINWRTVAAIVSILAGLATIIKALDII